MRGQMGEITRTIRTSPHPNNSASMLYRDERRRTFRSLEIGPWLRTLSAQRLEQGGRLPADEGFKGATTVSRRFHNGGSTEVVDGDGLKLRLP